MNESVPAYPRLDFVTYTQLHEHVRQWSNKLPTDYAAVAGVPRSGVLVASLLALHRNIPLITLADILESRPTWQQPVRRAKHNANGDRVLLVDDSVSTGQTFQHILTQLPNPLPCRLDLGAVYGPVEVSPICGYVKTHVTIPQPRVFEWNVFHSQWAKHAIWDIDGVLCYDPDESEADEGPGLESFKNHLENVPPKHIPSVPVMGICTGRLEKYRPQTEAWLARQGVKYGFLQMSPHTSARERRAAGGSAGHKARVYHESLAVLFIESGPNQAAAIAKMTRRPVLCVDKMEMLNYTP